VTAPSIAANCSLRSCSCSCSCSCSLNCKVKAVCGYQAYFTSDPSYSLSHKRRIPAFPHPPHLHFSRTHMSLLSIGCSKALPRRSILLLVLLVTLFLSPPTSAIIIEGRFVDLTPSSRPHARVFLDHGQGASPPTHLIPAAVAHAPAQVQQAKLPCSSTAPFSSRYRRSLCQPPPPPYCSRAPQDVPPGWYLLEAYVPGKIYRPLRLEVSKQVQRAPRPFHAIRSLPPPPLHLNAP
jgi:hypothetical protein